MIDVKCEYRPYDDMTMGQGVIGQMGHQYRMGHVGHGFSSIDINGRQRTTVCRTDAHVDIIL